MAKALEIISPNEIYSDLIFKDPAPPHTYFVIPTAFVIPTKVGIQNPEAAGIYRKKPTIYKELTKPVDRNASNERIANRALDFFSSGLMDDSATEEQYNALYDLTLLEEPGMELDKDEITALINSLK